VAASSGWCWRCSGRWYFAAGDARLARRGGGYVRTQCEDTGDIGLDARRPDTVRGSPGPELLTKCDRETEWRDAGVQALVTFTIYLRRGRVLIPTLARTQYGVYIEVEPVEVASADNIAEIDDALQTALSRGNPSIPHPDRDNFPTPVVMRHAEVKSWSSFVKGTKVWSVSSESDTWTLTPMKEATNHSWEEDIPASVSFDGTGAVDEVIRATATAISQAQAQ